MDKDVKLEEWLELMGILGDDFCKSVGCSPSHMFMADDCDECRANRVQGAGFHRADEVVRKPIITAENMAQYGHPNFHSVSLKCSACGFEFSVIIPLENRQKAIDAFKKSKLCNYCQNCGVRFKEVDE